jgi:chemotaxis protein CheZ
MSGVELMTEEQSNPSEEDWDALKDRARLLVDSLEQGDFNKASSLISDLNETRDSTIYLEVGKLTRGLHDAIRNFDIDTSAAGENEASDHHASQMANAQDRLDYVINLTQKSADKTMDMVEEGIPLAAELGQVAQTLKSDWERLRRREMNADEFRTLYHNVDQHLLTAVNSSTALGEKFNEILLAQDFQDLTGQVIKKVISLVQEVEDRLVELMRVAGQVEELSGIIQGNEKAEEKPRDGLDSEAEGPQINAEKREDVVSGQDDVDDLLSSLGF